MKNTLEQTIDKLKEKMAPVIPATISYLSGLGLGLIGKNIKQEWIPAVPPTVDLIGGAVSVNILFYGAGVATAYLPELYHLIQKI